MHALSLVLSDTPQLSVIVPTFNRAAGLPLLIDGLLTQRAPGIRYEILVVDNASTDATASIAARYAAEDPRVVYVFAPARGASHARNAGIARARGDIIAFIDDDVLPARDWMAQIVRAFDAHPDVDCIGGRIEPLWPSRPPPWLTPANYPPLAVQLARPAVLDARNAASCLVTANLACRRHVFTEIGGFAPEFMRDEDREFNLRLWRSGKRGMFVEAVRAAACVQPERLTRAYHRRWYHVTGTNHGRLRYREVIDHDGRLIEPVARHLVLGVPAFLWRELASTVVTWAGAVLAFRSADAFRAECHVRYLISYIAVRVSAQLGLAATSWPGDRRAV